MITMKFNTEQELLKYTENIKNKTFREIDTKNLLRKSSLKKRKGLLGNIVESGFYDYPINSAARADFDNIGIELKVSGYILTKKGEKRAKERLVLSKIDYNKIIGEEFEFSKLISKNKKILIIWYHYEKGKDPADFLITDYQLYDMEQDIDIIKNDFEMIRDKVDAGNAHELSESDTAFLGACTKARTSKDRTRQPHSTIPAKPRAFSLKQGYINGILSNLENSNTNLIIEKPKKSTVTVAKNTNKEKTLYEFANPESKPDTNKERTVLEFVKSKFEPYFGKTQLEIYKELFGKTPNPIPKNLNKIISDQILGKDKELKESNELFKKTNYLIKNLPITDNNKARERMSFKNIRLSEFEDDWNESYWKNFFEENTLITICYQGHSSSKNGERVLKEIRQITFDDDELDSMEKTFNLVKKTIETENISNLPIPHTFDGQILEIAPKASKGKNTYETFLDSEKTKVCFILNKKFLNKKILE